MTTQNTINVAKVSIALVIKAIQQGLEKDILLPRKLYCAYKCLEDIQGATENYLLTSGSDYLLTSGTDNFSL